MKILLATITRNRKGQAVRTERTIEAETPGVGRGAQCVIHLPDPRVALDHATIFKDEGAQRIAGVGAAVLIVDGRSEGELVLAPGSRFELGPYLFNVESPPPGYDLALMMELVRPLPDDLSEIKARSRFSLTPGGVSKRAVAWGLFGAILVLLLLVPIIVAITPALRATTVKLKMPPDLAWNAGPLSQRHNTLAHDCGRCHEIPFIQVRDNACTACHKGDPAHVRDPKLQKTVLGDYTCRDCHPEHRDGEKPTRTDSALCTQCHADLKHRFATTTLADVANFPQHPEFKLTLRRGTAPGDVVRVSERDAPNLIEVTNLEFRHDLHLVPNLKAPKGKVTLGCGNCHRPDGDDVNWQTFLQIDMKRDCQECHTLNIEPEDPTRQVPHGSVKNAWLTIRDFYANIELTATPVDVVDTGPIQIGIPKPSSGVMSEEERRRRLARAARKTDEVSRDLFEKRVCVVCHDVRRTVAPHEGESDASWSVAAVKLAGTYMPKARFAHGPHLTGVDAAKIDTRCKSCHDVVARSNPLGLDPRPSAYKYPMPSRFWNPVAVPEIATCRTSQCHSGYTPAAVNCEACHDYHLPGAMKPQPNVGGAPPKPPHP